MKDFRVERWVASVVPGAIFLIALSLPWFTRAYLDTRIPKIETGHAVLLTTLFLIFAYVAGTALWGFAYWTPINHIIMIGNRKKVRVRLADKYTQKRHSSTTESGEDKPRRLLSELADRVLPDFQYDEMTTPKKCYTIFETAMTSVLHATDTPLLTRIIWERELIGMLQCLILSFYFLLASLIWMTVRCFGESHIDLGDWFAWVLPAAAIVNCWLILHLRLRNRLLVRDVVNACLLNPKE